MQLISHKLKRRWTLVIVGLVFFTAIVVIGLYTFTPQLRITFSSEVEQGVQAKIINDLLSGDYRKNIQEGYGLEVYQETSEFCISQGKDSCTYLACRIYTSSDKKDWIPCSIEQDERGNYYVYNLLD